MKTLHAVHPHFGGVLTAGRYATATGAPGYATILHGGTHDVGDAFATEPECLRAFAFQVGKNRADEAHERAHTEGTFVAGERVESIARGSAFAGGVDRLVGVVVTGAERLRRADGVGEFEPHVRVHYDGDARPAWEPVSRLTRAR